MQERLSDAENQCSMMQGQVKVFQEKVENFKKLEEVQFNYDYHYLSKILNACKNYQKTLLLMDRIEVKVKDMWFSNLTVLV